MEKILIVEDELDLALNIKEIVENFGYKVAGIHADAQSVLSYLETSKVDLILMDIQIKGDVDGIDLCYKLKDIYNIPIVFLTAYSDQTYLDRISNVLYDGYLLKPFKADSLKSAIFLGLKSKPYAVPQKDLEKLSLKIRDKGYVVPVPISDIIYLKADGLYTKVFTHAKSYTVRDILKDLQAQLPDHIFLRPHKSYLVNINHIDSYNSKELNVNQINIPIRRGFYKELSNYLN
ncbi:two component transcriptional regulator, LytTR family [Belliella buryatensis]|uniref:Two component transcriptional regulator, LytTR family n=1 Tax=Belliella buryatensis TaxID=1500549 RepID=A0A239H967_9BACT|nr:response regulator [Belliella buryatensis]SNS77976.1 two component transcriptional regulator, LytTR family [Belliella buryatensis]